MVNHNEILTVKFDQWNALLYSEEAWQHQISTNFGPYLVGATQKQMRKFHGLKWINKLIRE